MRERQQGFGNSAAGSAATAIAVAMLSGAFALVGDRLLMIDLVMAYGGLIILVAFMLGPRASAVAAILSAMGFASLVLWSVPGPPLSEAAEIPRVLSVAVVVGALLIAVSRWFTRERGYRRIAQELAESQLRFTTIMTYSTDVLVEMHEGVVTYVGPNAPDQEYLDARALLGHHMGEFICPDDLPRMARYAEPGWIGPIRDRFRVRDRRGNWRWVETSGFRSRAGDGTYGAVHLVRDVDAEQRQQVDLRNTRDRLEALLAAIPDLLFEVDGTGRILDYRAHHTELLAAPPDAFLGRTFQEVLPVEAADACMAALNDAARDGFSLSRQYRLSVPAGERWFEASVAAKTSDPYARPTFVVLARDVTARVQAEEALRLSEERLNEAQRIARIGSWELDLVRNVLTWSDEIYRIFEIDQERFGASYEAFLEAIHPEDREAVDRAYTTSIETRTPYEITHRLLMADGRIKWVQERSETSYAEDGKPLRSLGTVQDITEQVRAAEALHTEHAAIESSINGIAMAGLDGALTYVNPSFVRLWGLDAADEALGRSALEFWETPQQAAEVIAALGRDGSWRGEMRAVRRDGSPFIADVAAHTVRDQDGRPVRMMASFLDVTAQREAEQAVRESEARYRTLTEQAPLGIVTLDLAGRVTSINPAALRIVGGSPTQAHEQIGRETLAIPQALSAGLEELISLVRNGGAAQHREFSYTSAFEKTAEISLDMAPLLGADGAVEGVIAIFEDVTERKRLESRDLQSQKMEAIGRLAGGVAHDVNNLMTAITVTTELDMAKLPPEQVLREDLGEIHATAQRAADLASQLLTFSRRQIIEPRPIDLCALVAGTHRMLSRLIGEDVEFIVRAHTEPCFVLADPGQMEQVLVNLAVNARDAMPNGGTLTIAVGRAARNGRGERVALTVSDTGTGIPQDAREHIFEPFFTTKGRGQGTGLGLATVYGIVQQAGGEIDVASGERGTAFTITLPLHRDTAADKAVRDVPERLPGGSETILLVEDEPAVRRPAARALRELGYTVLEAGDGASALAVCEERGPEIGLVVTDVVMPRMSGAQLSERLMERCPDLRVLFISGYTGSTDVQARLRPGMVDFIPKPFSQQELAERIRALLDGHYSPATNS